jgi:DNA-binding transcriptional MocR family regulator
MTQYPIRARGATELVESVEAAVVSGALAPGQRLPSVRSLAAHVGLSPGTVASGIAELRRRGVVVTEPRRGARIGPAPPLGGSSRLPPLPRGARDLSRGNPDPALLPDFGAARRRRTAPARLYGAPSVIPELAARARAQLRADAVPADAVCVVNGAHDGIERVLHAHLRPGDRVAVENPGYAALFDLLRAHGLSLRGVGVDERGMRSSELAGALADGTRAVVITPRGQNPTGAALDAERARELRAVLDRWPGVLVIEDDHLGPLAGSPLFTTVPGRAHWALTRSVSKALGPDLRLAILAGDALTIARVEGRLQCGPGWVSHVLQRLVVELWGDREVQALVRRARGEYARRRQQFLRALDARGISAGGASGLNVWIEVDGEAAVVAALLARGWVVAPGAPYRLPGSNEAIRITTATLQRAECERLADDLASVLAGLRPVRSG